MHGNFCPICQTPIRSNAKLCTLHATAHGMQFTRSDVHGAPCAREGCSNRLPKGWKPRVAGSTQRRYCCPECRIKAKRSTSAYIQRHRDAQSKYMANVRELERKQRKGPRSPKETTTQ